MRHDPKTSLRGDSYGPRQMTAFVPFALCVVLHACSGDSPTSPSTTTTTTTTVPDTAVVTEEFSGTIGVGESTFYSFVVGANGTVSVTLTSIGGAGVPSTVWMGLGLGTPSGEDCATSSSINGPAGSSPQLTGAYVPSIYCVKLSDLGNLYAPAQFSITIAHP